MCGAGYTRPERREMYVLCLSYLVHYRIILEPLTVHTLNIAALSSSFYCTCVKFSPPGPLYYNTIFLCWPYDSRTSPLGQGINPPPCIRVTLYSINHMNKFVMRKYYLHLTKHALDVSLCMNYPLHPKLPAQ